MPAEKERPQVPAVELRWNRDCLVPERAILVRISPQLMRGWLKGAEVGGPADGGGHAVESLVDGGGHAGE